MTALDWDYDASARVPTYRTTYRGVTILAHHDCSAENPFTAWGCEPPTLVYQGRREGFSDYSDGAIHQPLKAMSDGAVSRHWRAIAKALGITESDHESEAREHAKGRGHLWGYSAVTSLAAIRRDLFETALDDACRYGSGTDYLETLAALWRLAGCAAETWGSNGYSQSDWAEGLSVATPEWAAKVGAPRATHERQLKAAGKLWGAWAWGDVYGYVIETPDDDGDSCWGYYGDDFEESGLAEAARDAVDHLIRTRRRRRQARAAELIRARVPLALRPALLDATA